MHSVADEIIQRHTKGTCILDGEMVVWNKKRWDNAVLRTKQLTVPNHCCLHRPPAFAQQAML